MYQGLITLTKNRDFLLDRKTNKQEIEPLNKEIDPLNNCNNPPGKFYGNSDERSVLYLKKNFKQNCMSGFPILDLVVGMIFIYFLLSIISSSAVEIIMTALKVRSAVLEKWLLTIFDKKVKLPGGKETVLGQAIMDHCSVTALSGTGKAPSYIDAKNFVSALLEKVTYDPDNPKSVANDIDGLISAIEKTETLPSDLRRVLLSYANEAKDTVKTLTEKTEGTLELFRKKIENWFDASMDRLTGYLKKTYSRRFTFWIGFIIVCSLNADSIALAKYLYSNPEVRTRLAETAYSAAQSDSLKQLVNTIRLGPGATLKDSMSMNAVRDSINNRLKDISKAKAMLADIALIGWKGNELVGSDNKFSPLLLFTKITGLLASILAIMMGAPFWFDLLNKISNMRSAGAKPPSTTDKK